MRRFLAMVLALTCGTVVGSVLIFFTLPPIVVTLAPIFVAVPIFHYLKKPRAIDTNGNAISN
jgi:ribose/xylose/arabinose/galactoside ABC-type transport system permease subunit